MTENEILGNKIRKMRKAQGLTLSELAQKIEKTPGYLSQIERGLAEPSISALRAISSAFNLPIFYFLIEDDKRNAALVKKKDRRVMKFTHSHISFELVSPDIEHQMEMIEFHLEPGASTCKIPQSHQGEECSLVTRGFMKIQIGNEIYMLEEGDSIYYLASTPHRITNIGEEELIFISAITPPGF